MMRFIEKGAERVINEQLPSAAEQREFLARGLTLDHLGRPLHPWRETLPNLAEGKGFYWQWGPNYTADPIVISRGDIPRLLLIRRRDNGLRALPGGFIDTNESPHEASRRELCEETGIVNVEDDSVTCYHGPVHDDRSTRNAWPETTAILWHTTKSIAPIASDDAIDAEWVSLRDIRTLQDLHGSHATLIDMAIRDHGTVREKLEYFGDSTETIAPTGGHMGYDRTVATLPSGARLFVKHHDTSRFTDQAREAHSRRYLRKEHHVYRALVAQTPHIPTDVELIEDHTLLMEAYDPRDGWHWRAPSDPILRQRYISDTLSALRSLETANVPEFGEIGPAYRSIVDEGWGSYQKLHEAIKLKLQDSPTVAARSLTRDLDALYAKVQSSPDPELASFAHFDIRQSNLAWHPERGVRIIDWSWADTAPTGVDTTSFLIDLAKAGYDVREFQEYFDDAYARTLIGFWLAHSTWPTPTPDQTVREQQLGSAIAAYQLLQSLGK